MFLNAKCYTISELALTCWLSQVQTNLTQSWNSTENSNPGIGLMDMTFIVPKQQALEELSSAKQLLVLAFPFTCINHPHKQIKHCSKRKQ